jgi:hypothetical protein
MTPGDPAAAAVAKVLNDVDECELLSALPVPMNARSLACSEPDLLSGQTNSTRLVKKFITLSIDVDCSSQSFSK